MGNNFSNQSSDNTIGFRNTNINNYSSTLPGNFQINKEVTQVINNLPLPNLDNNQKGGYLNLSEESLGINDIFKKLEKNDNQNNQISETSPFISSDMYNFLMKGGAKNKKTTNKKTKGKEKQEQEEQEETSLTIDSSDESESVPEDKSSSSSSSSSSSTSDKKSEDDELNYESSSAHTESSNTDSESEDQASHASQAPEISSVNTSDIKLITES